MSWSSVKPHFLREFWILLTGKSFQWGPTIVKIRSDAVYNFTGYPNRAYSATFQSWQHAVKRVLKIFIITTSQDWHRDVNPPVIVMIRVLNSSMVSIKSGCMWYSLRSRINADLIVPSTYGFRTFYFPQLHHSIFHPVFCLRGAIHAIRYNLVQSVCNPSIHSTFEIYEGRKLGSVSAIVTHTVHHLLSLLPFRTDTVFAPLLLTVRL